MAKRKVGVWLVGAWGGVATTVVVGLAALRKGLTETTGLVTSLPSFSQLDLIGWDELVIGGHEIRETSYAAEAQHLVDKSRVFDEKTLAGISTQLAKFDRNIKPGTLVNVGENRIARRPERPQAEERDRRSSGRHASRRTLRSSKRTKNSTASSW